MITVEDIQTMLDEQLPYTITCPYCELDIDDCIPYETTVVVAHKIFELIQELGIKEE